MIDVDRADPRELAGALRRECEKHTIPLHGNPAWNHNEGVFAAALLAVLMLCGVQG